MNYILTWKQESRYSCIQIYFTNSQLEGGKNELEHEIIYQVNRKWSGQTATFTVVQSVKGQW